MSRSFAPPVAEQAVHWLLASQDDDFGPRQQAALAHWLDADPEHRRAWEHIQQVNRRFRMVASPVLHVTLQAPPSPARRHALKALLLAGVVTGCGLGLQTHPSMPHLLADYRSPLGQRRRLTLDDGSLLQLNTASAADVQVTAQARYVRLLEGEAQLDVRAGSRPLSLETAGGRLQLEHGRFNVRRFMGYSHVSVLDGVAVLHGQGLQAGQQARLLDERWQAVAPLDPNVGAWVDGMLVASHMRLADFLDELSRYRPGRLGCSERIAGLRVSGSYPLDDSERILRMLSVALPVRVRRFTRYWVQVEPA